MLHLGEQRLSFADKQWALPISVLWECPGAARSLHSPTPAYDAKPVAKGTKPAAEKLRVSPTKLAVLCRKYGIARLSLFGSASRNELTPG